LCCLFFFDIRILITAVVSFGHCVVCSSLIDGFWLKSVYRRRTDNTMAKRYHRGNQNPYIEEEQTTQWPNDTTGVIRIRISKKNRQHNFLSWPLCCLFFFDLQFMWMFCRSLFVHLSLFFWPLCCLSFFDLRILITPLVSSNSSSYC
jgi:hypothetical protein